MDALVQQCDFKTQGNEAVKQINKFVADATKNMIPSIMDNVAADTIWILVRFLVDLAVRISFSDRDRQVNAVSFKGKWAQQFSPEMTQKSPFHKLDGSQIMVRSVKVSMPASNLKKRAQLKDICQKDSAVMFI